MDWYESPVSDDEIVAALGSDLLPAFRYAQERLAGKVRKVTLEPSFCHSADVAFRALGLGYPPETLMVSFLHDVVEDTCRTIADVPNALDELSGQFPDQVVADVRILTNRYQLIFNDLVPKVHAKVPFEPRTARALRAALDVLRYELPANVADQFEPELDQLANFFEDDIDWTDGLRIAKRDKKFTVAKYIGRMVYRLYVDDMAARALDAKKASGGAQRVTTLVVKFLDLTDNIRTSEIGNRLSLYKLINKAESLLDRVKSRYLDPLPGDLAEHSTLPQLHRLVQLRLVDQLGLRHRVVAENFAETRFGSLVDFLAQRTAELAEKYSVPEDPISEISALEDEIRATNAGRV
jgi:uncharacterized protein (DUF2267 family)